MYRWTDQSEVSEIRPCSSPAADDTCLNTSRDSFLPIGCTEFAENSLKVKLDRSRANFQLSRDVARRHATRSKVETFSLALGQRLQGSCRLPTERKRRQHEYLVKVVAEHNDVGDVAVDGFQSNFIVGANPRIERHDHPHVVRSMPHKANTAGDAMRAGILNEAFDCASKLAHR